MLNKTYLTLISLLALIFLYFNSVLFNYFIDNLDLISELILEHVIMVSISMFIATVIGLFVGVLLTRDSFRRFRSLFMYIIGLGQTIPSLAILALAMSTLGIGMKPVILALTIYSILPIARNTIVGLDSVSEDLLDAAKGMGLSPYIIFWEVELPNALAFILTGIRIALIINIGTAALGALVGAGGLGDQIFTGISFLDSQLMLSGAIPTALLVLVAYYLFLSLEKILVSKGLQR
ncbi:ABC transporter permease [Orenia marismortui]|uniref:ABC transporter permease n=1 Tax=Orenia marismortui TaxID=46469 RepID=UPI0003685AF5|nr:ABC transporter permease [Orenia marismortui]